MKCPYCAHEYESKGYIDSPVFGKFDQCPACHRDICLESPVNSIVEAFADKDKIEEQREFMGAILYNG